MSKPRKKVKSNDQNASEFRLNVSLNGGTVLNESESTQQSPQVILEVHLNSEKQESQLLAKVPEDKGNRRIAIYIKEATFTVKEYFDKYRSDHPVKELEFESGEKSFRVMGELLYSFEAYLPLMYHPNCEKAMRFILDELYAYVEMPQLNLFKRELTHLIESLQELSEDFPKDSSQKAVRELMQRVNDKVEKEYLKRLPDEAFEGKKHVMNAAMRVILENPEDFSYLWQSI